MTKKDYFLIASVLKEFKENEEAEDFRKFNSDWLIEKFGEVLYNDNPRFTAQKFEDAINDTIDGQLKCTHESCKNLQVADGEFCKKHIISKNNYICKRCGLEQAKGSREQQRDFVYADICIGCMKKENQ